MSVIDVDEFLGARGDGIYAIRPETHGAFGGAFGGLVAAIVLREARRIAPGRPPVSIDINFLRGVPVGDARVDAAVVHAGRSLSCVRADVFAGARLATRATVKLADSSVLADVDLPGAAAERGAPAPYADGRDWPNVDIPLVATFGVRTLGADDRGIASGLRVPWDDGAAAGAEAACLAGDLCVGAPVGAGVKGRYLHPNPDLSMRFVPGAPVGDDVTAYGRLERGAGGMAAVAIEVWSAGALMGVGVSCSLLLRQ